jgi:hypothetical protein
MTTTTRIDGARPTAAVGAVSTGGAEPAGTTATATLLPDPALVDLERSGDMGAEIAALVVRSARENKQMSRDIEKAEEKIEAGEEAQQVAAMRDQADDIRKAGLTSGMADVGGGLLTAGGGVTGALANGEEDADTATTMDAVGRGLVGGGTVEHGLGQVFDGQWKGAAKDDEARATQHEQAASHAKRATEQAYDDVKDARDLGKAAVDFFREFTTAEAQSRSAALHRA